jgi:hypothetical protein
MPRKPAPPPLEERYFTAAELAERYHVSELTLRNWRWQRTGPQPRRIGRRPLYPASEVARWEASLGHGQR